MEERNGEAESAAIEEEPYVGMLKREECNITILAMKSQGSTAEKATRPLLLND